eukprot:SAG31_NODE_8637_length_1416_cov_1.896735_1_plen_68_part_00
MSYVARAHSARGNQSVEALKSYCTPIAMVGIGVAVPRARARAAGAGSRARGSCLSGIQMAWQLTQSP